MNLRRNTLCTSSKLLNPINHQKARKPLESTASVKELQMLKKKNNNIYGDDLSRTQGKYGEDLSRTQGKYSTKKQGQLSQMKNFCAVDMPLRTTKINSCNVVRKPLCYNNNNHQEFVKIAIGAELFIEKQNSGDEKTLKWSKEFIPLSKKFDEVDEIYKEADPIQVSLQRRIDRGALITTVLRDTYSTNGRFYFDLKLKEPNQHHQFMLDEENSSNSEMNPFTMDHMMNNNNKNMCDEIENSHITINYPNNPNMSFNESEQTMDNRNDNHILKKCTTSMSQANGSTKLKYAKSGIGGGVLMNRKKMRDELLDYD